MLPITEFFQSQPILAQVNCRFCPLPIVCIHPHSLVTEPHWRHEPCYPYFKNFVCKTIKWMLLLFLYWPQKRILQLLAAEFLFKNIYATEVQPVHLGQFRLDHDVDPSSAVSNFPASVIFKGVFFFRSCIWHFLKYFQIIKTSHQSGWRKHSYQIMDSSRGSDPSFQQNPIKIQHCKLCHRPFYSRYLISPYSISLSQAGPGLPIRAHLWVLSLLLRLVCSSD